MEIDGGYVGGKAQAVTWKCVYMLVNITNISYLCVSTLYSRRRDLEVVFTHLSEQVSSNHTAEKNMESYMQHWGTDVAMMSSGMVRTLVP